MSSLKSSALLETNVIHLHNLRIINPTLVLTTARAYLQGNAINKTKEISPLLEMSRLNDIVSNVMNEELRTEKHYLAADE